MSFWEWWINKFASEEDALEVGLVFLILFVTLLVCGLK